MTQQRQRQSRLHRARDFLVSRQKASKLLKVQIRVNPLCKVHKRVKRILRKIKLKEQIYNYG